jgi:hypothetical protein
VIIIAAFNGSGGKRVARMRAVVIAVNRAKLLAIGVVVAGKLRGDSW